MTDDDFPAYVVQALAALPGVEAVALGGSRAQGTAGPHSDWDFGLYYRGDAFHPASLREIGWDGQVFEIGDWGGGVFNGGAWMHVGGRKVDVLYRDLDVVDAEIARAARGEFDVEPLMFHLAGIPTYLLLAELAGNLCLSGALPSVDEFPSALRTTAASRWSTMAAMTLDYATGHVAPRGAVAQFAGLVAVAASQRAHAILAERGEWICNEKRLLQRAGVSEIDRIVARLDAAHLAAAADDARRLLRI